MGLNPGSAVRQFTFMVDHLIPSHTRATLFISLTRWTIWSTNRGWPMVPGPCQRPLSGLPWGYGFAAQSVKLAAVGFSRQIRLMSRIWDAPRIQRVHQRPAPSAH